MHLFGGLFIWMELEDGGYEGLKMSMGNELIVC